MCKGDGVAMASQAGGGERQYGGGGMLEGNLRGLKIAVIVMGVLIVLATALLVATIIRRQAGASSAASSPPAGSGTVLLDEPAGTRIGSVVAVRDGVALLLQGGGPDRVVLVDPTTGRATERIGLAR